MTDQPTDWIDKLACKSPTALAMALERAIATGNRALEGQVLAALRVLGIAVVDRATLADELAAANASVSRKTGEVSA